MAELPRVNLEELIRGSEHTIKYHRQQIKVNLALIKLFREQLRNNEQLHETRLDYSEIINIQREQFERSGVVGEPSVIRPVILPEEMPELQNRGTWVFNHNY